MHISESGKDDNTTCKTCCEQFSTTARKPITCPSCNYTTCLTCVRHYMRLKGGVVCTACNQEWDKEFLETALPKAFLQKDYKIIRQKAMFEREMALMPGTQAIAQAEVERRALAKSIVEKRKERKRISELLDTLSQQISQMEQEYSKHSGVVNGNVSGKPDGTVFHNKCPVWDCHGYLGSNAATSEKNCLECGMCKTRVCQNCLETLTSEAHSCKKDNIKSVSQIRQECKQCPKCAVLVYKASGCDQMWCTICHTTFSWKTGRQDFGPIHNPHWYEWQASRSEADMVDDDIGMLTNNVVPSLFSIPFSYRYLSWVPCVHRLLMHLLMHTLPRFMSEYSHNDNLDLRVNYLLHEIDEKHMKRVLQQRETRREKDIILKEILASFVCICSDLLRRLGKQASPDVQEIYMYLENARLAANMHMHKIAPRFSCKEYCIDDHWCINDGIMVPSQTPCKAAIPVVAEIPDTRLVA